MLTNKDKFRAIHQWQNSYFHPLTCGKDSRHKLLVAYEKNKEVVLKCISCDYIQEYIPEVVLDSIDKHSSHFGG